MTILGFSRAIIGLLVPTLVGRIKRLRRWQANALALAALTGLVLLLFRAFLTGEATLIGNPDRPNTFLNILKFHADAIRAGKLQAWDEYMFGGFDTFGIAYTFPNPLTYLAAHADPDRLFLVANFISIGLLALAGWAAYAYLRVVVRQRFYAFLGAALYQLSFMVVFNAAQNDMSFLPHVLIPLGMLALRRILPGRQRWPFLGLAAVIWVLLFFTFLQLVAYTLLLFGFYTLHRARQLRSWAPVRVFTLAFLVALVGAAPRIYTVKQEMALVIRNKPGFPLVGFIFYGPREILRFFSDSIYGRNQEQANALQNGINTSEGMLLYISTFAAFLLVVGACRFRGQWFRLLRYRDGDLSFFLYVILGSFAVIAVRPLAFVVYLAFLKGNFHHARIVTIAVLPACALVAVILKSWGSGIARARPSVRAWIGCALAALVVGVGIHLLGVAGNQGHRILVDQPLYRLAYSWLKLELYQPPRNCYLPSNLRTWNIWFHDSFIHPYAARQLFWSFIALAVVLWLGKRNAIWRPLLARGCGLAMIVQLFLASDYKVNANLGRPADAPPITNNNDIQVAGPNDFRPPSAAATARFAERLETDRYRTALINPRRYRTLCPSFLAHFWRLRLIEGYGSAVPTRLFALPMPRHALTLQSINYLNPSQLDWQMLAQMNVKYVVVVNDAIYMNRAFDPSGKPREARPDDVMVVENPFPVVPRVFFTRRIKPVPDIAGGLLAQYGESIISQKPWAFRHWPEEDVERLEDAVKSRYRFFGPLVDWLIGRTGFGAEFAQMWTLLGTLGQPLPRLEDRPFTLRCNNDFREGLGRTLPLHYPNVQAESCVEDWPTEDTEFAADGPIDAAFRGDRIDIRVTPSDRWRFLVLNELHHPAWHAHSGGKELQIYPTNIYMRGIALPPGTGKVTLTFRPFVTSGGGMIIYGTALLFCTVAYLGLRRRDRLVGKRILASGAA